MLEIGWIIGRSCCGHYCAGALLQAQDLRLSSHLLEGVHWYINAHSIFYLSAGSYDSSEFIKTLLLTVIRSLPYLLADRELACSPVA